MKTGKFIKTLSFFMAAVIAFSTAAQAGSNFVYTPEERAAVEAQWEDIQADSTVISLSVGAKAGEIRFSWLSGLLDGVQKMRISENKDMSNARELKVKSSLSLFFMISNKAVADNLEQGKTYWYSYTEKGSWSEPESFTVQPENRYTVLFTSDAQLGRSKKNDEEALHDDTCGWQHTVKHAFSAYPDAAFVISAGDQTEQAFSLKQYRAFLSPGELRNYPIVQTIGNHDFYFPAYSYYSNNPNRFKELLASPAGNGFYFCYGEVLYIVLNSNDMFSPDQSSLMRRAVSEYPDAKWRVAVLHHSVYSSDYGDDFSFDRTVFAPLMDNFDIDIALSGHDHMYSRTFPIYASEKNENGTVYVQASSASGSNIYGAKETKYIDYFFDEPVATYTALEFDGDVLSVKTHRTDDDSVIDSFEMTKKDKDFSFSFARWITLFFKTFKSMV